MVRLSLFSQNIIFNETVLLPVVYFLIKMQIDLTYPCNELDRKGYAD